MDEMSLCRSFIRGILAGFGLFIIAVTGIILVIINFQTECLTHDEFLSPPKTRAYRVGVGILVVYFAGWLGGVILTQEHATQMLPWPMVAYARVQEQARKQQRKGEVGNV